MIEESIRSQSLPQGDRVQLLDANTINQIAAGEVVERPASVVKELVENALDAGASWIEVDLEASGQKAIRVRDDGCGMSESDVPMCLERHATSKIRSIGDLSSVITLGFRGEALPSMASVSRLKLSSGISDGLRAVVEVEGGIVSAIRHEAGPRGTTVEVEDLFFNTPARLKFLKSDATELSQCVEAVQKAALAAPHVRFVLRNEGATILQTPGDGDLLGAIVGVWGRDIPRTLVAVDQLSGGGRVRGFVSLPTTTKPTRAYQWIYVNGRPVKNRALLAAIDQGYRSLTPEKRYPPVVLMLDVDPARVDCNVSPSKTEVKFQQEGLVFDAVRHTIRTSLLAHGIVPDAAAIARVNEVLGSQGAQARLGSVGEAAAMWYGGGIGVPAVPPLGLVPESSQVSPASSDSLSVGMGEPASALGGAMDQPGSVEKWADSAQSGWQATLRGPQPVGPTFLEPNDAAQKFLDGMRVIGQFQKSFIVAENKQGLLVIDQHVAHERILYEMLKRTRGVAPIETQTLLAPETLHLDRRVAAVFRENLEDVRSLGFAVEDFGGRHVLGSVGSSALKRKNPLEALKEIAEELAGVSGKASLVPARDEILIMCSCKLAIKAGDVLSLPEMEKLLWDLAHSENPYLCPHGRPIAMLMSIGDVLKKFHRA